MPVIKIYQVTRVSLECDFSPDDSDAEVVHVSMEEYRKVRDTFTKMDETQEFLLRKYKSE